MAYPSGVCLRQIRLCNKEIEKLENNIEILVGIRFAFDNVAKEAASGITKTQNCLDVMHTNWTGYEASKQKKNVGGNKEKFESVKRESENLSDEAIKLWKITGSKYNDKLSERKFWEREYERAIEDEGKSRIIK